jgi:hypothetical protein
LLHYGLRSASMKTGRFFADQNFINDFKNKDSLFCCTERLLYQYADSKRPAVCRFLSYFLLESIPKLRHLKHHTRSMHNSKTLSLRLMYPSVHGLSKKELIPSLLLAPKPPYCGDVC